MLCLKISRWHMGKSQETMQSSRLSPLLSLTQRILSRIIVWCWNISSSFVDSWYWMEVTILLVFYLFVLCLTEAEIWLRSWDILAVRVTALLYTAATAETVTATATLIPLQCLYMHLQWRFFTVCATLKSCPLLILESNIKSMRGARYMLHIICSTTIYYILYTI